MGVVGNTVTGNSVGEVFPVCGQMQQIDYIPYLLEQRVSKV
jgi:hypothetical protein